jgi:hypothetical protein
VIVQTNPLSLRARAPIPGLRGVSSASLDRRSKDIRVLPIVIAKLELGDIERHIFSTHFVERSDHTALENRPETFDGLGMNCSDDVLGATQWRTKMDYRKLNAEELDNQGISKALFAAAMTRLLATEKIRIEETGPKSRRSQTIVPTTEIDANDA